MRYYHLGFNELEMQTECVDVWGKARKVVEEAAQCLLKNFVPPLEGRIFVEYNYRGSWPFAHARTSDHDDFRVEVICHPNKWNQLVYQFAHELLHCVRDNRGSSYANAWFDEALGELASIFVLKQMAASWRASTDQVELGYAKWYDAYADDRLTIQAHQLPANQTLGDWLKEHEVRLRANHEQRDLNGVVAIQLFPLLDKSPSNWQSIRSMPRNDASFADYVRQWHAACPAERQPFIAEIGQRFGIHLA